MRGLAVVGCLLAVVPAGFCRAPADGVVPVVHRTAEPVLADGPVIRVDGSVVTPDGQAVAGAAVFLRVKTDIFLVYHPGVTHVRDVIARTTTDAAGRFSFDGVGIPPRFVEQIISLARGKGGAEVLAVAAGRGLAWANVKGLARNTPARLTLLPEAKVEGVVRDKAGRGVPGVRVTPSGITRATEQVDRFLQARDDLFLEHSEVDLRTVTDGGGRFVLHGLPGDCRVRLESAVPGGENHDVTFVLTGTRGDDTELRERFEAMHGVPLRRPPLAVALERERVVTVRAVDHAGKPVSGGAVRVFNRRRNWYGESLAIRGRGEARVPFAAPGQYRIQYTSDPLEPRISTSQIVTVPAGDEAIEVRLPEPRWLTGRVLDADTGKAVAGAYVCIEQQRDGLPEGESAFESVVTDRAGAFRLPVTAGTGRITVGSVYGYRIPRQEQDSDNGRRLQVFELDVPPMGDIRPVTVKLPRAIEPSGE